MTQDHAVIAGQMILERYLKGIKAKRTEGGFEPSHLVWMILELSNMTNNKCMRWLGYIQGVLVAQGIVSLEEMKQLSREASEVML